MSPEDIVPPSESPMIADIRRVVREEIRAALAERPAPSAPGAAPRAAGGAGGGTVRFGRDKGKRLSDVADLSWYRKAVAESVEDPGKTRYRAENERHLAEIDAAMGKVWAATSETGSPDFGPADDDIPF